MIKCASWEDSEWILLMNDALLSSFLEVLRAFAYYPIQVAGSFSSRELLPFRCVEFKADAIFLLDIKNEDNSVNQV